MFQYFRLRSGSPGYAHTRLWCSYGTSPHFHLGLREPEPFTLHKHWRRLRRGQLRKKRPELTPAPPKLALELLSPGRDRIPLSLAGIKRRATRVCLGEIRGLRFICADRGLPRGNQSREIALCREYTGLFRVRGGLVNARVKTRQGGFRAAFRGAHPIFPAGLSGRCPHNEPGSRRKSRRPSRERRDITMIDYLVRGSIRKWPVGGNDGNAILGPELIGRLFRMRFLFLYGQTRATGAIVPMESGGGDRR